MQNQKKKHNKIVMIARSKLNSIESKISKALINIINKETMQNLNKTLEWWKVKEVILKKLIWLNKVKKVGNDEVIKHN